jgi:hypothetical protein
MSGTLNPDVPFGAGVPTLVRTATAQLPAPVALLVDDALSGLLASLSIPQWGLFSSDGAALLIGDSVLGVDYRNDYNVPTYPIEEGGFASFNKTKTPFDIKLQFTVGGSVGTRAAFLETAEQMVASLDLISAVTPEYTYPYVNPVHVDYSRTQRSGVTLITVSIYCNEIRLAADSAFSNTSEDDGADPAVNGQTQTTDQNVPAAKVVTYKGQETTVTGNTGQSTGTALPADGAYQMTPQQLQQPNTTQQTVGYSTNGVQAGTTVATQNGSFQSNVPATTPQEIHDATITNSFLAF